MDQWGGQAIGWAIRRADSEEGRHGEAVTSNPTATAAASQIIHNKEYILISCILNWNLIG